MSVGTSALEVSTTATVRDAIGVIDASGRQVALVVDAAGRLAGIVTDGDVRRGILRGVALEAPTSEIMNATPKVAHPSDTSSTIEAMMVRFGIRHLPIVDDAGAVVGLVAGTEVVPGRAASTPVVLMAGGRGERLYPLTKDLPKPMLPVGGVPLMEIILRNLALQGFTRVHISVNYLADVIVDHVGDGSRFGLQVDYLREERPLGTAGALAQLTGAIIEPFIVMNSDLLTHVNLKKLVEFHVQQAGAATIGVREHEVQVPFGVVRLNGSRIESMEEKPVHRSLVNAGIYAVDPTVLDLLVEGEYCDMPSLLGRLMSNGTAVCAFPIHEPWLDVGRPEDLTRARNDSESWLRR